MSVDKTCRFPKSIKKKLYRKLKGCQCCGGGSLITTRDGSKLEVHHYLERVNGGKEVISNAVLLCSRCHVGVHQGLIVSPLPLY